MNIDKFGHHVHKRLRVSELFDFDDIVKKTETGEVDFKSSYLKGIPLPKSRDHAVNKEYVDNLINNLNHNMVLDKYLKLENKTLDLQYAKIKNLQSPSEPNDAVNKNYVDKILSNYCTKEQLILEKSNLNRQIATLLAKYLGAYYTKSEINKLIQASTKHE